MTIPRADSEYDARVLQRIMDGEKTYAALSSQMDDAARLDVCLDRSLEHEYITFRFTGRTIRITDLGRAALEWCRGRGRQYGRLVDAKRLYPEPWKASVLHHPSSMARHDARPTFRDQTVTTNGISMYLSSNRQASKTL